MTLTTHALPPLSPFAPPSDDPADYLLPVPDFDVAELMERDYFDAKAADAVLHPLAVGAKVCFRGYKGVVIARNPNEAHRYEVEFFDDFYHVWRRKWVYREQLTVLHMGEGGAND